MPDIPATFDDLLLHTPRLRLRPLSEGDAEALLAMFSDAETMRYWSTPPWTRIEQAHALIAAKLTRKIRKELGLDSPDAHRHDDHRVQHMDRSRRH